MKAIRIIAKSLLWFIVFIIGLHLLLIIALMIPYVQQRVTGEALEWLSTKTGAIITLDYLSVDFPFAVTLEGLYAETPHGDTLAYAGQLDVGVEPFSLLDNTLHVYNLGLRDATVNITRGSDSVFNFNHFIEAFANPDKTEDSTKSGFDVTAGDISLSNVRFLFDDSVTHFRQEADVGKLKVNLDDFSIVHQVIEVDEIELSDTRAYTRLANQGDNTMTPRSSERATPPWQIFPGDVVLTNVQYALDLEEGLGMHAQVGELTLFTDEFDLEQQRIHLDEVTMSDVVYEMVTVPGADTGTTTHDPAPVAFNRPAVGWDFLIATLEAERTTTGIHQDSVSTPATFDPAHLLFESINLSAANLRFNDNEIAANIDHLGFSSGSWRLREAAAEVLWTDEEISVRSFAFQTPYSEGEISVRLTGNVAAITTHPERLAIEAEGSIPAVNVRDIRYFVPGIDTTPWYETLEEKAFALELEVAGDAKHLLIYGFHLQEEELVEITASADLFALDDYTKLNGSLRLDRLYMQSALLDGFLPDSARPANLRWPGYIDVSGDIAGSMNDLAASIRGYIDQGSMEADGSFAWQDSVNTTYDVRLHVHDLALGYYLQNDSIGPLSFKAEASGRGIAPNARSGRATVEIIRAEYIGYTYEGLQVAAELSNEQLSVQSAYSDSNLIYDLSGRMSLEVDTPSYAIDLNVDGVDLQALNLVDYDARYSGRLLADFSIQEDTDLIGTLSVTDLGVVRMGKQAFIDSLLVASAKDTGVYSVLIRSDLLRAHYRGNVSVLELPAVVKAVVNQHYDLNDTATLMSLEGREFAFKAFFQRNDILNNLLIPGLEEYVPGRIQGEFNGTERTMAVGITMPRIKYKEVSMDSFVMDARADPTQLTLDVRARRIAYDTLPVERLYLSATLAGDEFLAHLRTGDEPAPDYSIRVQGRSEEDGYVLRIPDGTVILNASEWMVSTGGELRRKTTGWTTKDVVLTQGSRKLMIRADTGAVLLDFDAFALSAVTGIVATRSVLLDGQISGTLYVGSLVADLRLSNVTALGYPAGDLQIEATANAGRQGWEVDVMWTENGHRVVAGGRVNPAGQEQMNLHVDLAPFNLSLVQGFVLQHVSDLHGNLRGTIDVRGTFKAPSINGRLSFEETQFRVMAIGTSYRLRDETIEAVNGDLWFRSFSIYDSTGQALVLNGSVKNRNYRDFDLDLTLRSSNFRVLNAAPDGDNLLKGVMITDLAADIRGSLSEPRVDGRIKVKQGTEVTFVIPQSDLKAAAYEGVVEFYDEDIEQNTILGRDKPAADSAQFRFIGVSATLDVEIDRDAVVRIVVDEISGDHLFLQGGGTLAVNTDAFGNFTMTGVYLIQRGHYQLSFYELVKKKFTITGGSNIRWLGDPMQAQLDIRAMYRVRTSADNLFIGTTEVSGTGQVPIDVYLNMRGPLMTPEVDFDIEVPRDYEGAYGGRLKTRLAELNQNESELNKQVFGLLVLNSFLPEEAGEGSDNVAIARASASRILTNQLNKLSETYLKGVELSVNVSSYESADAGQATAGNTELELAVRKRFLDNRLEVLVGGDVALEGEQTQEQTDASDYIGDAMVSYKLTDDGRYRLKAFRETNFEGLLEGQVIETGMGIGYSRSYDAIRELFRKPEEQDTSGNDETSPEEDGAR